MAKIKRIIKKRNNTRIIGGAASINFYTNKAEPIYTIEQMVEMKDNEIYFNATLKINLNTKAGKAMIDKMQKENKNPLYKTLKEAELNLKNIYTEIQKQEDTDAKK